MKTFCPFTTYRSPLRTAVVFNRVVSVPVFGSVTPKAWSLSSPEAIFGRYALFCSSDPCRSRVPMMYICAWQAPELPPERLTSSRMTDASVTPSPEPPYASGIRAARYPAPVRA
jgi:hypothetical protein